MLASNREEGCGFADSAESFLLGCMEADTKSSEKADPLENAKEGCQRCINWQQMREKIRVAQVLGDAIKTFEEKLKAKEFKPTVAEYLKLLQLEKEIEERELTEGPKEITVTWVDPTSVTGK